MIYMIVSGNVPVSLMVFGEKNRIVLQIYRNEMKVSRAWGNFFWGVGAGAPCFNIECVGEQRQGLNKVERNAEADWAARCGGDLGSPRKAAGPTASAAGYLRKPGCRPNQSINPMRQDNGWQRSNLKGRRLEFLAPDRRYRQRATGRASQKRHCSFAMA